MLRDPDFRKYLEYAGLGVEIAVAFSVPILIGYWADSKWDTSPWLLLAGILLGLVLMLGIFSKLIRNMNKKD